MPTNTNPKVAIQPERARTFEEAALCRSFGASFVGCEIDGRRVVLKFNLTPQASVALKKFRMFSGPVGDLSAFAEGLRWAKDRVFEHRREAGLEQER